MRGSCLMVHFVVRHSVICVAVYLAMARSRSPRFLACIMIELTTQCGLGVQIDIHVYQTSGIGVCWEREPVYS